MDIILRPHFFGGKNNNYDSVFVPLSVKSVLANNPDSTVYFISNDPLFKEKNFPDNPSKKLICFLFEDLDDANTNELIKNYVHLSTNPLLFEKYSILCYFYIYNLICRFNIDKIIVVETDVLIFCNLTNVFKNHYNLECCDAILGKKKIICSSYVNKVYLETYVNSTLKMYSDRNILQYLKDIFNNMQKNNQNGGICDMTINGWINDDNFFEGIFRKLNSENKNIYIEELTQILPDNSYFDNQLSALVIPSPSVDYKDLLFDSEKTSTGVVIKKIYNNNNEPYFKINNRLIKCNSIHFQGKQPKFLMPDIFNTYVK